MASCVDVPESDASLFVRVVGSEDDLDRLVGEINDATWDEANAITPYDVNSLRVYLQHPDTLFVACHSSEGDTRELLGMASARFELKPYEQERWLYVDEVDVRADRRRQGAGKAIMRKLLEVAWEADCEEVWLGTETDNVAANALYRSLDPDEVDQVVGYTWELDD